VEALGAIDPQVFKFLEPVTAIVINSSDPTKKSNRDESSSVMRFEGEGMEEEFSSMASIPKLPNISSVTLTGFEEFSLEGAGLIPKLAALDLIGVKSVGSHESLLSCQELRKLRLRGLLGNFKFSSQLPQIRELTIECEPSGYPAYGTALPPVEEHLVDLVGLASFPGLEELCVGGCYRGGSYPVREINPLFNYALSRNVRVSCSPEYNRHEEFKDYWTLRFSFHAAESTCLQCRTPTMKHKCLNSEKA
jgi:hypothetical protein